MFVQRFKSSIGRFYFFLMLNIIKNEYKKWIFLPNAFRPLIYIFLWRTCLASVLWLDLRGLILGVKVRKWKNQRWYRRGTDRHISAATDESRHTVSCLCQFALFQSQDAVFFNGIRSTHFPTCYVRPSISQHCVSCTPCCCGPGHHQRSQRDTHPLSTGCQSSFFCFVQYEILKFSGRTLKLSHVKRELELLKNFAVHSCLMCHFLLEQ